MSSSSNVTEIAEAILGAGRVGAKAVPRHSDVIETAEPDVPPEPLHDENDRSVDEITEGPPCVYEKAVENNEEGQNGVVDISDILLTSAKDVFASKWVESLRLEPHPLMSNCYYKETYKDSALVKVDCIDGSVVERSLTTLNYFLHLPATRFSKSTLFYQSRCSSVTMHFYGGRPCSVYFVKPPTAALSGSGVEDSGEAKKQSINLRRALLGPCGSDKGQISQVVITKVGPCFMSMHFLTNSKIQRFQAQGTWFTRILESSAEEESGTSEGTEFLDSNEFSLLGVSFCPGFNYADIKTATFDVILSCNKRST